MAQPRVFLSSPYYGLREVRDVVGAFIREHGFEDVMFEAAHIPYGTTRSLKEDCYEEIKLCDMLVSIVGQRFGSDSGESGYSVSQMEVRFALEHGIPVYVFVEQNVLAEHRTYVQNQANSSLALAHVDDPRVFNFLDELYQGATPIFSFQTAGDIKEVLRKQWAGLFQRLLKQHTKQIAAPSPLPVAPEVPKPYMSSARSMAHATLQDLLNVSEPVAFRTLSDLSHLLASHGFRPSITVANAEHWEWDKIENGVLIALQVSKHLFDDHKQHIPLPPEKWHDDFLMLKRWELERRNTSS